MTNEINNHFIYTSFFTLFIFIVNMLSIYFSAVNCYSHRALNTDHSASHSANGQSMSISCHFYHCTHIHTRMHAHSLDCLIGMHGAYELKRKLKSKTHQCHARTRATQLHRYCRCVVVVKLWLHINKTTNDDDASPDAADNAPTTEQISVEMNDLFSHLITSF